jgi:hypothetical protein
MTQPWSLSRLEIRAPLTVDGFAFARVEVDHATRGRLCEIGRGTGPVDSMFRAIGQIVGLDAEISTLDVDYRHPQATARIALTVGTMIFRATATSDDILTSCATAYLKAAAGAQDL